MIYLSAQPDDYYFLWQLQLQIFNFHKVGIKDNNIHVLIGFNPNYGLNPPFLKFINHNRDLASFFIYEDTREERSYPSSIRPHIISKHFIEYPDLQNKTIFYHDSDILIREQIKLRLPVGHNIWYASDTSSYTGINCILSSISKVSFDKICSIIDIKSSIVLNNEDRGGGAQYILTGTDWQFWKKVESDCEKIYTLLKDIPQNNITDESNTADIQRLDCWLTDIWVLRWNALRIGYNVLIHDELDFCWISSPIDKWTKTKILHYTGINDVFSDEFFIKSKYKIHSPFHDDFHKVNKETCSAIVVNHIDEYNTENYYPLFTHSIIIIEQDLSNSHTINILVHYYKDCGINVLLVGDGIGQVYPCNVSTIPSWFSLSEYILSHSDINTFIIIPNNCITPAYCLKNIMDVKYKDKSCNVFFIKGTGYKIDLLTKFIFEKSFDDGFLSENKGKFKKINQTDIISEKMKLHVPAKVVDINDNLFFL